MKAVFVAGGTGGHVYPALEIARESKKSGVEIHWIGKEGSLEKDLSLKEGFNFEVTKSSGFRKKNLRDKIISIYYLIFSLVKSILLFKKIKPDFIFCCGGYLSLGPGLASFLLRIPLFIHEQNSIAGSANRILSILAIKIFITFLAALALLPMAKKFTAESIPGTVILVVSIGLAFSLAYCKFSGPKLFLNYISPAILFFPVFFFFLPRFLFLLFRNTPKRIIPWFQSQKIHQWYFFYLTNSLFLLF